LMSTAHAGHLVIETRLSPRRARAGGSTTRAAELVYRWNGVEVY
jgi:hypothetical protein